jgi:motility quorum-sensing regulator/GCU-specific mRNA interferase toxin
VTRPGPTYPLVHVHELVRARSCTVTSNALSDAYALGLDEDDVTAAVLAITPADFYKTMPSVQHQNLFQDVYRPWHTGHQLYVTLQVVELGEPAARRVVVISFKKR